MIKRYIRSIFKTFIFKKQKFQPKKDILDIIDPSGLIGKSIDSKHNMYLQHPSVNNDSIKQNIDDSSISKKDDISENKSIDMSSATFAMLNAVG